MIKLMKYEVEKANGFGSDWIRIMGHNAKSETMEIEIVHCTNPKCKDSLPELWFKEGLTSKVLDTYITCHTYVTDSEGGCYGGYNPTVKLSDDGKRNVIDFDWLLEDTEENQRKIIDKCIELFQSAKGKSATERKIEHVLTYAKIEGLEVVDSLPDGYVAKRFVSDPLGAISVVNGNPIIKVFGKVKKNPLYKRKLMIV